MAERVSSTLWRTGCARERRRGPLPPSRWLARSSSSSCARPSPACSAPRSARTPSSRRCTGRCRRCARGGASPISVSSSACSASCRKARRSGLGAELVGDLDHGRTEEQDDERGEDAPDHREQHLEWGLLALLLGALPALATDLLGLDAQHVGDSDAELLRLNDRLDEVAQLLDLAPPSDIVERLETRTAEADLVEHDRELSGEFVVVLVNHASERGIEAQAGFHRDGEQVERARQGEQDLLLTLLDATRDHELRSEVPEDPVAAP